MDSENDEKMFYVKLARPVICYKTGVIYISQNLINWNMFVLMSEPALICENNTIFKQNYAQKLFIAFKMT